jgi:hypothetical protein
MKKRLIMIVLFSLGIGCSAQDPQHELRGIDIDQNGVRDDVEEAILAMSFMSTRDYDIAMFAASIYQKLVLAGDTYADSDNEIVSLQIEALYSCYRTHTELSKRKSLATIRYFTFNTVERVKSWDTFSRADRKRKATARWIPSEECKLTVT